ncbi:MAG: hypothetical protein ABDH21_02875 [bacterium]
MNISIEKERLFSIYDRAREYNALCRTVSEVIRSHSREVRDYVPISFSYINHLLEIQEALEREFAKALDSLGLEREYRVENLASSFMKYMNIVMPEKSYYVKGKKVEVIAANSQEAVRLAKESDEFINRFSSYLSKPFNSKHYVVTLQQGGKLNASYMSGENVVLGGVYNEKGNSVLERDVLYHELGHSFLNSMVPRARECFHEAFADITAFLNQASKPDQIKDIKDFRKSNRISQIAENTAIAKFYGMNYVRDLSGQNRYKLNSNDAHGRGAAVATAFYRTWANYVESLKSKGISQEEAVRIANDKFSRVAIKAAENLANHKQPSALDYAQSILKNLDTDPEIKKLYYSELEKIGYQQALKS